MNYEIKHIYYGHKSRKRGDNVRDAMNCYCELADEIIYVDGNCNVASFPDKNIGWEKMT